MGVVGAFRFNANPGGPTGLGESAFGAKSLLRSRPPRPLVLPAGSCPSLRLSLARLVVDAAVLVAVVLHPTDCFGAAA